MLVSIAVPHPRVAPGRQSSGPPGFIGLGRVKGLVTRLTFSDFSRHEPLWAGGHGHAPEHIPRLLQFYHHLS